MVELELLLLTASLLEDLDENELVTPLEPEAGIETDHFVGFVLGDDLVAVFLGCCEVGNEGFVDGVCEHAELDGVAPS